jgi:hypothetical protein
MTVHVAIIGASEVSAESKALHLSKEIGMIREGILKWAMLLARFPHEDASALFQYLRLNDSGVVSKIRDIHLTLQNSLHRFAIAIGTQRLSSPGNSGSQRCAFPLLQ